MVLSIPNALKLLKSTGDVDRFLHERKSQSCKEVSLDEFLSGCMRLRGMASNVDINVILMQTKRLNSQIASLRKRQYEQLSIL